MSKTQGSKEKPEPTSKIYEVYYTYCPRGEACSKGAKYIKRANSREEGENIVVNHLTVSHYHGMKQSSAEKVVKENPDCVTGPFTEMWDDADIARQAQEERKQKTKAKEETQEDRKSKTRAVSPYRSPKRPRKTSRPDKKDDLPQQKAAPVGAPGVVLKAASPVAPAVAPAIVLKPAATKPKVVAPPPAPIPPAPVIVQSFRTQPPVGHIMQMIPGQPVPLPALHVSSGEPVLARLQQEYNWQAQDRMRAAYSFCKAMARAVTAIEASATLARQAADSFDEQKEILKRGIDQMVFSFGLDPEEFRD